MNTLEISALFQARLHNLAVSINCRCLQPPHLGKVIPPSQLQRILIMWNSLKTLPVPRLTGFRPEPENSFSTPQISRRSTMRRWCTNTVSPAHAIGLAL